MVESVPERAPPVAFTVDPPVVSGRRAAERTGLILALVELGLADLPGVAPAVAGRPPAAGLDGSVRTGEQAWRAWLDGTIDPLALTWTVCDPVGDCSLHRIEGGDPANPAPIAASILEHTATRLLRAPPEDARAAWTTPVAGDDYARLVAGRAAATTYGWYEPRGSEDPISRALALDPATIASAWMSARRHLAEGDPRAARAAIDRAVELRPSSTALLAAQAAQRVASGQLGQASRVYAELERRHPEDPRFALPAARVELALGRPDRAAARLDPLPPDAVAEAQVAALRVAVAEARGQTGGLDALLAEWQAASPDDPEPVRRRVAVQVAEGRYADALSLTPDLRDRGEMAEADAVELALLAALGRFAEASERADGLGDALTAGRLRARAADDPLALDPADDHPAAVRWRARRELGLGRAEPALAAAEALLRAAPWDADAEQLRAEALDALGRPAEAEAARARLARIRPIPPVLSGG